MGSVADIHHIKLGIYACLFLIYFAQSILKYIHSFIFNNTYSASAKTAACYAGADDSVYLPGLFSKDIALLTGCLIIITKRNMGIVHKLTEGFDVVGL